MTLTFLALSASDLDLILTHYSGQLGAVRPFAVPTEVWDDLGSSPLPVGYEWRYQPGTMPQVAQVACDLYDVLITLQVAPKEAPLLRPLDLVLNVTITRGAAISALVAVTEPLVLEILSDAPSAGTTLTDAELRASPVPVNETAAAQSPTTTSVASSASSVTILAANSSRQAVWISNISTATLYLSASTPATTANAFMAIPPDKFVQLPGPVFTGAIYGIWSAADGTAQVTELT